MKLWYEKEKQRYNGRVPTEKKFKSKNSIFRG